MKKLMIIFCAGLIGACNDNAATKETTTTTTGTEITAGKDDKNEEKNNDAAPKESPVEKGIAGCYLKVVQRDTVFLKLIQDGKKVSGTMAFDNYQKDSSHGTVQGTIDGDLIKLFYEFNSEGMHSVSEQVLKVDDGNLVLATGEIAIKHDTAYFPDDSKLKFEKSNSMKKADCGSFPQYLQ